MSFIRIELSTVDDRIAMNPDNSQKETLNAILTKYNNRIKTIEEGGSSDNNFTDADHTKLNGIDTSATADQTAAEIRTLVESASDSNVFTDADHTKLNGITASANNYSLPTATADTLGGIKVGTNLSIDGNGVLSSTDTNTTYSVGDGGLTQNNFTDADHTKLNGITASANNYSLPTATANTLGGIKVGTNLSVDGNGVLSSTDTDTTYSEATGSAIGLMSTAHHDKLDGIEASADVTDTANVTAAGALMDSEVTDLAGIKGVTISTLQVKPSEGAFANGDKTKLDGITASANNYSLPTATANTLGGIKVGTNLSIDGNGVLSSTDTNTTYSVGDGGLTQNNFTDADHTKLNGITASANNYSLPTQHTTITSVYNQNLKIGRDSQNLIDFASTDNKIIFRVNNANEYEMIENSFSPKSTNGASLGSSSLMWSDLFLASGGVIRWHDGTGESTITHSANTIAITSGYGSEVCALTVEGDITALASDKRLKKNIEIIKDPLKKLNVLSGFTYDWSIDKCEEAGFVPKDERQIGVFAQDVQSVIPEAVKPAPFDTKDGESKSGDNYLTVQYEKIVPLLIESIKEQQNMIDNLQGQIDELKSKII